MTVRRTATGLILAATALAGGCGLLDELFGPGRPSLTERIRSADPKVRTVAIIEAGETRDANTVAALVGRLGDGDEDVRMVSILALEKITGTRLGYRYWAGEAERQRAIRRWLEYLRSGAATRPTSAPAGGGGPEGRP